MRSFLFVAASLVLVSCFDKGDCLFTNTNVIKVFFMDAANRKQPKAVIFDAIVMPLDNKIVTGADTIASIGLVVNPNVTETMYVFLYGERSDTLVLSYTTQTIVLAPDCGSYNYQGDLEVKHSTFGNDRVIITNRRLLTSVQNNVEIFF